MTKIILLDSTPVGLITNPKFTPLSIECQQWFHSLFEQGYSVILPEIIDYEDYVKTIPTLFLLPLLTLPILQSLEPRQMVDKYQPPI
jgi:hypothetical protein